MKPIHERSEAMGLPGRHHARVRFCSAFRTERFAPSASDYEFVKAAGHDVVEKGFAVLDKAEAVKIMLPEMNFAGRYGAVLRRILAEAAQHEIAPKRFGVLQSLDGAPLSAAGLAAAGLN